MKRNYNHIFAKIVDDDYDLVGHIAYSLYKKSKIEYIENQHKGGKILTDMDLIPFNDVSSSASSIDNYRSKAEQIFRDFIDTVLGDELENQKDDAILKQIEILKSMIKSNDTSFGKNVWAGILSSFLFALFLAILYFIKNFGAINISLKG